MARRRRTHFNAESHNVEWFAYEWGVTLDRDRTPVGPTNYDGTLRILYYEDEPTIPLGEVAIPGRFWVLIERDAVRYVLGLVVENGRLITDHVIVKRPPGEASVTAIAVRQVKLDELIQLAVSTVAFPTGEKAPEGYDLLQSIRELPTYTPHRGNALGDEHYDRVAAVYRDALLTGRPPTRAVAETFHAARSSAGRWVMEARRRGFLGEATPGQSGEKPRNRRGRRKR